MIMQTVYGCLNAYILCISRASELINHNSLLTRINWSKLNKIMGIGIRIPPLSYQRRNSMSWLLLQLVSKLSQRANDLIIFFYLLNIHQVYFLSLGKPLTDWYFLHNCIDLYLAVRVHWVLERSSKVFDNLCGYERYLN